MIIWNELKKIFELKMVLVLLLISLIMYQLFISFDINYFPNGRPALDEYNISVKMIENYGTSMDIEEYQHFKKTLDDDIETANRYLESKKEFVEAGVTTYEGFERLSPMVEEEDRLRNLVMFDENADAFWEIETKRGLIDQFENKGFLFSGSYRDIPVTETQENRMEEVAKGGHVFPHVVFDNYNNLISYVCALTLISVMFMISTIFLRDKNNKIIHIQYSSKTGRGLYIRKLVSAMLASFIIITIQLGVFFLLYSKNNTLMFFKSNINSFLNNRIFWFDLTFFQYITFSVLVIYILGFFMSVVIAILSSMVPNYLTVIGVQVPLVLIFSGFLIQYLIQTFTEISLPIYFAPVFYAGLIVTAAIFSILRWTKEERIDLVI